MMKPARIAVLLLVAAALTTGCSRRAAFVTVGLATLATGGVAGYFYARGDLEVDRPDTLDHVHWASLRAMEQSGFEIESDHVDDLKASIQAKSDENVIINMRRLASGGTHISIRVGTFGNEALSARILEHIDRNL